MRDADAVQCVNGSHKAAVHWEPQNSCLWNGKSNTHAMNMQAQAAAVPHSSSAAVGEISALRTGYSKLQAEQMQNDALVQKKNLLEESSESLSCSMMLLQATNRCALYFSKSRHAAARCFILVAAHAYGLSMNMGWGVSK